MCMGTSATFRGAVATRDTAGAPGYIMGWWQESTSFQKARVSWLLYGSSGHLSVQAYAFYSQDGVTFAGAETVGTSSDDVGIPKVQDLFTPDPSYRFVVFGFQVARPETPVLDVESGTIWATVDFQ